MSGQNSMTRDCILSQSRSLDVSINLCGRPNYFSVRPKHSIILVKSCTPSLSSVPGLFSSAKHEISHSTRYSEAHVTNPLRRRVFRDTQMA
jgi:hypothetical protein